MIIYIIKNNKVETFTISLENDGNYWVSDTDENSLKRNLINIVEDHKKWKLTTDYEFELYSDGQVVSEAHIQVDSFYFLKNKTTGEMITIFITKIENNFTYYQVYGNTNIKIGKDRNCQIFYNNSLISNEQANLSYQGGKWHLTNLDVTNKIFVNGVAFESGIIPNGVTIFIAGLKIIPLADTLIMSNPAGSVTCNLAIKEKIIDDINLDKELIDDDANITVYKKSDYFNRAPRFRSKVETLEIKVDEPPTKDKEDETPAMLTYGPMMTMGLTSLIMIYNGVNNAVNNGKGIGGALPSIIMGVAMLGSIFIWPTIIHKYTERKKYKEEIKRRDKYEIYIQSKRQEIVANITTQRQILISNFISLEECSNIILNRKSNLWERRINDDDFLQVRLGLGSVPLDIDIKYPEEKFTLEEDILKDIVKNLVDEAKIITGAPITVSLQEKRITGVVGNYNLTSNFMLGLLLQLCTFYTGDMLKIVILTKDENVAIWQPFKALQHNWSNDKSIRFFGSNIDEIKDIEIYLDKEYQNRITEIAEMKNSDNQEDIYKRFSSYYFIVTDNYKTIAEFNLTKNILKNEKNVGFSMLIASDKLSNLPNECTCFININKETSGLIENELTSSNQKEFVADMPDNIDINACCMVLANIPINIETKSKGLPDGYDFLEMYNIGKVEQLNCLSRWKSNDPTISLSAPVGIDESGELFKIDLHEKFHGPHGLVAGTTGSGKSEWIITFILSMAVNYHPYEVSFVIIDYKGGGLALAFENKELGIRLPHIVGTITNLDVNEMNRSLASIEAELKRRQKEFNLARDLSGESTIDIYKYQRLYREGVVKKPISHLFIISDEFAELKAQQPEFMDQLISTARIGRSLGVHLILATQKPNGVVNDQIWSNSRFKVCLKVQDKADSKDMIMVPDAAEIKQAGRFYLLVGYNDFFALGQAAYCGLPYVPSDKIKKKIDTSLEFVNNVGYVIKKIDDIRTNTTNKAQGEVLLNVVKYITNVANKENVSMTPLWLERIPNVIYVDDLIKKYNYQKVDFDINPIIGEYDSPATQSQHLLTLNLSLEGNTIIYGMAGSGKEQLISTLLYSSITNYTSYEINYYVIDCGAETLKMFSDAPHIGDVLLSSDTEKIEKIFEWIEEIIDSRKKQFVEFGGSFESYNKFNKDNKLPLISIIINNYESFLENFEKLEDSIITMARDCFRYGVLFIISVSSVNSIKMRLKSSFNKFITLQFNDPFDYYNVFGSVNKMVPSNNKGRGLIKTDKPYEFQAASICEEEKELQYVKTICKKLKEEATYFALSVPSLPDIVNIDCVKEGITNLQTIPIGILKSNLKVSFYDMSSNYITVISSKNLGNSKKFINGFIKVLSLVPNIKVVVCDTKKLVFKNNNISYHAKNFKNIINSVTNLLNSMHKVYVQNDYSTDSLQKYPSIAIVLIGLEELFKRVDNDTKKSFIDAIGNAKALEIVKVVLIDTPQSIKSYSYEDWYTSSNNGNSGIWCGDGITEQNVIKVNSFDRNLNKAIGNEFGYLIREGAPLLTKLVIEEKNIDSDVEILDMEV